jgi:type IV secretion system protein VirD4
MLNLFKNSFYFRLFIGFILSYIIISVIFSIYYSVISFKIPYLLLIDVIRPITTFLSDFQSYPSLLSTSYIWFLAFIFIGFLPAILFRNATNSGKVKSGLISKKQDLLNLGLNFVQGITLGKVKNKILKTDKPLSSLIIAPTGTGKTAGFIIPTLIDNDNSIICYDIKGELYEKTHEIRANMGHKILVLDPTDDNSIKFNPFSKNLLPKNKIHYDSYIGNIAKILFPESNHSGNGNYFINSARSIFQTFTLFLIAQNGHSSINQVMNMIFSSENIIDISKEKLLEMKESPKLTKIKEILITKLQNDFNKIEPFFIKKDDKPNDVLSTLSTTLSDFESIDIINITDVEKSSITISDLRSEKLTIYIKIDFNSQKRLEKLVSLFFQSIANQIMSNQPDENNRKITFILDEFGNIGKLPTLIKATTLSRGYNFNQIFVLQDLEQLSSIYSKEEKEILISNTAYKIILRQNNRQTAEYISKLIGNITINKTTTNKDKNNKIQSTSNYEQEKPIISSQELMSLDSSNSILIVQSGGNFGVVKCEVPYYFKDIN